MSSRGSKIEINNFGIKNKMMPVPLPRRAGRPRHRRAACTTLPWERRAPARLSWKSNTMRQAGDWRAQEGRKRGTRNELRYYERWRKNKKTQASRLCYFSWERRAPARLSWKSNTIRQYGDWRSQGGERAMNCATTNGGGSHRQDACATAKTGGIRVKPTF
jgi:hypothetical protein